MTASAGDEPSVDPVGAAGMTPENRVSPPLSRAIELLLMLLFLVSPLIISTRIKQVFNTPKYVLVGAIAVCLGTLYLSDCIYERRLRLPRNPGGWFLLGFVSWAGLSLLWSSDMAVASRDFGYHAAMAMIFLGAFAYGREEERVDNMLHFPIAAGVLAAGFGLLQYYGLDRVLLAGLAVWPLLALAGLAMAAATAARAGTGPFERPMLFLALLAGVAGGMNGAAVQLLGLLVTLLWIFYRSLDPRQSWLLLSLRLLAGVVALILSSMITGQLMVFLAIAILLDEGGETEDPDVGPALLSTGLLAVACTALLKGWDLSFLVLPKKPEEAVKVYSFMGHRNYLAGFLIAVLPLAVVRLVSSWTVVRPDERTAYWARAWRVGVYLSACGLMVAVLMLCHTRGAWIGCLVSLAFVVLWIMLKYLVLRPLGLLGLVLGILLVVVGAFGWKRVDVPGIGVVENPFNRHHQSAGRRLAETLDIQRGSAFQRALIYRTTWWIIFDHPINCLFGTGIGTFGLHYMPAQREVLELPSNRKYLPMINKSIYAHNEYWHYWSEVGLIGLLLLFGAAYSIGKAAHRRLRLEPPGAPGLMFVGMCASLVATGTHNFFTFDWHLAYTGAVFYALAGMVLAQSDGDFWVCSLAGRRLRPVTARGWSGEVELLVLDGGVVARAWLDPSPPPDAALVLTGPTGAKADAAPDAFGELTAVLDELPGTYRAELVIPGRDGERLELTVGRSSAGVLVAQGAALCGVLILATVLVQSLSQDILRDMYWRDGFLKFRARRFEEAFLDFERAVDADPTKGEVLFDFGRALMDSGRNLPAIKVFEQAKMTFVDPANDHNIALCYYKEGEAEKSEEHYRRAIHLNEIYEQSLANLSYVLIQQGRDDEAIPLLERGLEVYPRNASFPTSLAVALAKRGDYREAKEYFDKALALEPRKASVWINAGTVYYNLQLFEEAERAYRRAAELDPKSQLVKQKQLLLELARWSQRAREQPNDLDVRRNYAATLLAAGHVGSAATEARNVLRAIPDDWTMRFTYARALQAQGYLVDARRQYRQVVAGAPADNVLAVKSREILAALGKEGERPKVEAEPDGEGPRAPDPRPPLGPRAPRAGPEAGAGS